MARLSPTLILLLATACGGSPPPQRPTAPDPGEVELAHRTIVASGQFTCAIRDGRAYCWGDNRARQHGSMGRRRSAAPVLVEGISHARHIDAGNHHACALTSEGACCWGSNSSHQVSARGVSADDRVCHGPSDLVDLAVGRSHSCVLRQNGRAHCWGTAAQGELGSVPPMDTDNPPGFPASRRRTMDFDMARFAGPRDLIDVAAGPMRSCFVTRAGHVYCVGLGTDSRERCTISGNTTSCTRQGDAEPWKAVRFRDLPPMRRVETSLEWICGIERTGQVRCARVIGDGTVSMGDPVPGVRGATDLSISNREVCVVHGDGDVTCRAHETNEVRQLEVPAAVSVSIGAHHGCVAAPGGELQCWGEGRMGQLGRGEVEATSMDFGGPVTAVLGRGATLCGLRTDGRLRCLRGSADRPAEMVSLPPQPVSLDQDDAHGCAVEADGTLSCWDLDADGPAAPRNAGISDAAEVTLPLDGTCVRRRSGDVVCFGGIDGSRAEPVRGLAGTTAIAGGHSWNCAIVEGGRVSCWTNGRHFQRGPMLVVGVEDAVQIDVGCSGACARTEAGQVVCWAMVAHGFRETPLPPARPIEVADARDLAVGCAEACAVRNDGSVACWANAGTEIYSPPVERADRVFLGDEHGCAILDGQATCWGGIARSGGPAPVVAPVVTPGR